MKCRCIHCGVDLYDTDRVWQVRTVDGSGIILYSPTCSPDCAQRTQMKYIEIHKRRLHDMEHQSFQIMSVNDFPGAIK